MLDTPAPQAPVLAQGALVLPAVTVDTYNEELRDENGFVGEIKHFVDCIESGRTPEQGLKEGITVLQVILGGYQSEREKRVISI